MSCDAPAARPPRPPCLDLHVAPVPVRCYCSTHTEVRNQGGRHVYEKLTELKKCNLFLRKMNINYFMGHQLIWERVLLNYRIPVGY